MIRNKLAGIQQVVEGSFSAQTGMIYFIRKSSDTQSEKGYIQFNGKKYGNIESINSLPDVSSSDDLKVMQVRDGEWTLVTPVVVYSGTEEAPPASFGEEGDIYLQTADTLREPVSVYETNGSTGLLGHNQNGLANQWQLENLDLSDYKSIKCYFKAANTADTSAYTPSVVVEIPLDAAAMGQTAYFGGTTAILPFNREVIYSVGCAVDSTKTKFQVIHQNILNGTTSSDANDTGRYCYKIEGWY